MKSRVAELCDDADMMDDCDDVRVKWRERTDKATGNGKISRYDTTCTHDLHVGKKMNVWLYAMDGWMSFHEHGQEVRHGLSILHTLLLPSNQLAPFRFTVKVESFRLTCDDVVRPRGYVVRL